MKFSMNGALTIGTLSAQMAPADNRLVVACNRQLVGHNAHQMAEGNFALGLSADYTMAAIGRARAVVLEVNPNVPFTFGNCHVHVSQVAAIVESSDPVSEACLPKIGPVQQAIGARVADLVDDGSTLQIGYGGIPDAVVLQLTAKRDLGIHTEMIGDGILKLVEAGAVTNRRKNYLPGKMVATFALGSARLYRFMDRNPALEMHPADFTNDPWLAGPQRQPHRDQWRAAGRPAGPVRFREPGPESLLGHRRPVGLRAGRQPLARRQGHHRPAVDGPGRHPLANRAGADQRHARHHEQERRQLRGHRVRGGAAARQVGQAARAGVDRHRASGLPRRAGRTGAQDEYSLAALASRSSAQPTAVRRVAVRPTP